MTQFEIMDNLLELLNNSETTTDADNYITSLYERDIINCQDAKEYFEIIEEY